MLWRGTTNVGGKRKLRIRRLFAKFEAVLEVVLSCKNHFYIFNYYAKIVNRILRSTIFVVKNG
jgi:hypothetical protein